MGGDQWIAFQVWFSWKHVVIEKALNGAVLGTWLPHLHTYLKATHEPALTLQKWLETKAPSLLGRDKRNLEWLVSGSHSAEDPFLLRLALLLGKEVGELRPHCTRDWLAQATVLLPACYLAYRERKKDGRFQPSLGTVVRGSLIEMVQSRDWIPLEQAREYVDFLCACLVRHSFEPDPKHLEHHLAQEPRGRRICATAERLTPALVAIRQELTERRGKHDGRTRHDRS